MRIRWVDSRACSGPRAPSQAMKKKAISKIARGKLAKMVVFKGRKEIGLGASAGSQFGI